MKTWSKEQIDRNPRTHSINGQGAVMQLRKIAGRSPRRAHARTAAESKSHGFAHNLPLCCCLP
eukprot:1502094-Pleurochrysis_carterae.AAC.1